MNRLILIYPDQGEALNQFFLVIKKAKVEEKGKIFSIPPLPLSPSSPLPLSPSPPLPLSPSPTLP